MEARRRWVTLGVLVLVGLIGFIFAGYWFNWDWTGFNAHIGPHVPQYQPTKTLWDWLQLLLIPLVLAVAALLFNRATTRTEQMIALDKQREDLLQTYLDRMSELLLEKQLHSPASPYEIRNVTRDEVRNVAQVRTITILFQLDARRIGYVFAFLREAGLMSTTSESIVSLKQANLTEINFSQAVITEVDLRDTILYKANLSGAFLLEANLSRAFLYKALVTEEQLKKAKSLDLATMPDGAKHRMWQ